MTIVNPKALHRLRWLLVGGAFVLALGTTGCARFRSMMGRCHCPSHDAPPAALVAQSDADDVMADVQQAPQATSAESSTSETSAPSVNMFGEFEASHSRPHATTDQRVSTAGFQQHTFLDEGYDSDVAVDPTGKWLAFASTRHSEQADLYLQKANGLSVVQRTNDDAADAFPTFSPDGKWIAFSSTRAGDWDIYMMQADGHDAVQVTSGPMQDLHASFSPDGTKLVYCSAGSRSGQWELWTVDLRTNEKRMIGFGLFPTWSPASGTDRIAFQKARQRGSRWFSLWTLDLVDGEARRVTEVAVSTNAAIISPAWSPDGQRLAFSTVVEPARSSGGKPSGQMDVWTINADGSNRQRVTDGNGTNLMPHWSADNRVYFVSDRGGTESIWSARVSGATSVAGEAHEASD